MMYMHHWFFIDQRRCAFLPNILKMSTINQPRKSLSDASRCNVSPAVIISPHTDDPITPPGIAYFEDHLNMSPHLRRFLSERDVLNYAYRFRRNRGLQTQHFILSTWLEKNQTPAVHIQTLMPENHFSAAQFDICGTEQAAKITYVT